MTAVSGIEDFINVPAVAVVVVITSVVGGSFINAWYRRKKKG